MLIRVLLEALLFIGGQTEGGYLIKGPHTARVDVKNHTVDNAHKESSKKEQKGDGGTPLVQVEYGFHHPGGAKIGVEDDDTQKVHPGADNQEQKMRNGQQTI